jgi:hypothetical protein
MPDPLNFYTLNAQIADVGTASTVYFCVPRDGYLRSVETMLFGAITGADDVITVTVDGSAASPTITVANASSAAGDYDSANYFIPVKQGSRITIANSGASTGTAALAYTVTLSG